MQAHKHPEKKHQNWVEYWDDASQSKYYFNSVTHETSWTQPDGYVTTGSATDYDTDYAMDDEWKDWVEKVDKNTGETYWYNTKTGATEWTTFVDADGDGWDDRYAPFHEEDWETHTDPNSGSTYYVNKKTGETQWADFVDADGDGIDDRWDPIHDNDWEQRQSTTGSGEMVWYNNKTGEEAPLEDDFNWADWDELEDPQSGAIYYYNRQTGETQWA